MGGIPDIMFVIDTNKEAIAIQEARKLNIPVVAILDTNSQPGRHHLSDPGQRRRGARHPALLRPGRRRGARRPGRRPGGLGRRPRRLGSSDGAGAAQGRQGPEGRSRAAAAEDAASPKPPRLRPPRADRPPPKPLRPPKSRAGAARSRSGRAEAPAAEAPPPAEAEAGRRGRRCGRSRRRGRRGDRRPSLTGGRPPSRRTSLSRPGRARGRSLTQLEMTHGGNHRCASSRNCAKSPAPA